MLNDTLSIPSALKPERSEDYYKNTATIEWPLGPNGEAFPIFGGTWGAVVFKDGRHVDAAKEFVRFLVAEGWLAHYLDFAGERFMPPMQKLREGPLWLDSSDPHRMAAVMQIADAAHAIRVHRGLGRLALRLGCGRSWSGQRRSTASPPRASARNRPSTRRSHASSRS